MSPSTDQWSTASNLGLFQHGPAKQLTRRHTRILPSVQLASRLQALLSNQSSQSKDKSTSTDDQDSSQAVVESFEQHVRPVLESILPSSAVSELRSTPQNGDRRHFLHSTNIKLLVYACMNHMTPLQGQISHTAMYTFLQPILSSFLFGQSLDLSPPKSFISIQSEKAMAETLFGWAVEQGDHVTVARLMNVHEAAIDVNNMVCLYASTPVERSALLGHCELTRDLILKYGADVNKSLRIRRMDCRCDGGGALEAVLHAYDVDQDAMSDLLHVIVNAGGTICSHDVLQGLQDPDSHVSRYLVSLAARAECSIDWMSLGIFHKAATHLGSKAIMLMLETIVSRGMDLRFERQQDAKYRYFHRFEPGIPETPDDILRRDINNRHHDSELGTPFSIAQYPPNIIDILAQRGQIAALRRLHQLQVEYTNDTLVAAIRSCSLPMVQHVLASGVHVDCFSRHYFSTPLAEALQLDFAAAIPLLLRRLDLTAHLDNSHHYCSLLGAASQRGDMPLLKHLLKMADVAAGPALGFSLVKAVKHNHTEVGLTLLDAGASLDMRKVCSAFGEHWTKRDPDKGRWTVHESTMHLPLMYAVWNRNLVLVRALSDHRESNPDWDTLIGTQLDTTTIMGCAALWNDDIDGSSIIEGLRYAGWPADGGLLAASRQGKMHLTAYFLREEPSYEVRDLALEKAIECGQFSIAQKLMHHGARVDLRGGSSSSILVRIVATDCPDLLLQLVLSAQNVRPGVHKSILSRLLRCEREDVAQTLLKDGSFESPLHVLLVTAIKCHATPPFIAKMLGLGIDLNRIVTDTSEYRDWRRNTPLLAAIRRENLLLVSLLLEKGADVNLPATRGLRRTPIQQAAEFGSIRLVRLLLDKGADVKAPPARGGGVTSIQAAAIGGFIGIVELLIQHGEDFRAPSAKFDGRTALEGAAEHGRFDMIVYLTDLGLYDTKQYESAIRFAKDNGHRAIAQVLENDLMKVRSRCGENRDTDRHIEADVAMTSDHLHELIMSLISVEAANTDASETIDRRDGDNDDDNDNDNETSCSFPTRGARVADLDDLMCDENRACGSINISHMGSLPFMSLANGTSVPDSYRESDHTIINSSMADLSLHSGNNRNLDAASNGFEIQPLLEETYTETGTFTRPHPTGLTPVNSTLPGMDIRLDEFEERPISIEDSEAHTTVANLDPTWHLRAPKLIVTTPLTAPQSLAQNPAVGLQSGKQFKCTVPDCSFSADRNDTFARHMVTHQSVQAKRKHKCQRCGSAYSRGDTLKAHIKRCTGRTSRIAKG